MLNRLVSVERFKRGGCAVTRFGFRPHRALIATLLLATAPGQAGAAQFAVETVATIAAPSDLKKPQKQFFGRDLPMFAEQTVTRVVARMTSGDALIGAVDFMIAHASAPFPTKGKEVFVQAIRGAVATHPAIGAATADVGLYDAAAREVNAGFLPQVSGTGDLGYRSYGISSVPGAPVTKSRAPNAGMTLRQLVYDFGATSNAADAGLARQQQSQADLASARGEYTMRAISAYVDVLRMRSHMSLADQSVTARKSLLDQVIERARSGGGSEADVTRAEGRHVESQANASSVANRLSAAESQFAEIFGREPPAVLPLPIDPEIKTLDQPLPELLRQYAPAQSKDAARLAAEMDANASKSRALPRVDLQVSHTRRDWDSLSVGRTGSDTTAVLALRYDFYTGGADKARAEQSAWRAGRAALEFELVRRQFEHNLAQARADVKSTAAIQQARIRSSKAAVRSMEAVNEQFQFNRGSLLDAIKTQEELYAAGKDMIDAVADRILAKYRLLYFTSQLDDLFKLASLKPGSVEDIKALAGVLSAPEEKAQPKPKTKAQPAKAGSGQ